mgnify:FL=1
MSTAILLGLMLVYEPKEDDIMHRQPRDPKESLLTKSMVVQMLVVGFYMLVTSYTMFHFALTSGHSIEYARTVAVNIFVFVELFYLFNCKDLRKSIFRTNIFNNRFLLMGVILMAFIQVLFTHTNIMNTMFKSQALDIGMWINILLVSFGVIFIVELKLYAEKKFLV